MAPIHVILTVEAVGKGTFGLPLATCLCNVLLVHLPWEHQRAEGFCVQLFRVV